MHSWDSPLPAFQTERFLTGVLSNALKGLSPGAHFQTIPPIRNVPAYCTPGPKTRHKPESLIR